MALVLLSLVVAFIGFMMLSQATTGVGFIAGGILLAIYARLAQASAHHDALLRRQADTRDDQRQPIEERGTEPVMVHTPPVPAVSVPAINPWQQSWKPIVVVGSIFALVVVITLLAERGNIIDRYTATDPQPSSGASQFTVQATDWGWRVQNDTAVDWSGCVARTGQSSASIGELPSFRGVGIQRSDFSPAIDASATSNPTVQCSDRKR